MVVLVTGANGQLGQALQSIAGNYRSIDFVFCSSSDLDITNKENCETVFNKINPDYCINTAAYTAVDKAESEPDKAQLINVFGAKNIAETCKEFDVKLIHISTDFVFDGTKSSPYNEMDLPNPKGVYGQTKLDGEKAIQEVFPHYFIVRTSWVYSQFANNFMKTMLRLASEREAISVVNDQIGTPTNANEDLFNELISSAEKLIQLTGGKDNG
jgi:dTDP-4-dehydrorhamnose reductase